MIHLQDYFGMLNEKKNNLTAQQIEPPEEYILYKECKALGINLVDGGLMDQPYIWLQFIAIIEDQIRLWKAIGLDL